MKVLKFGEDVNVGCTLSLSREDLKGLCTDGTHPWLQKFISVANTSTRTEIFVPIWIIQHITPKEEGIQNHDNVKQNFSLHDEYVAVFANADETDESHWIHIEVPNSDSPIYQFKRPTWNSEDNSCSGIITGVRYDIHWTYVGSIWNPQAKIVSINVKFQDEIIMRHDVRHDVRLNITSNYTEKKNHWLQSSTVTWTFVDSRIEVFFRPTTKHFFQVPNDIFYPFGFGTMLPLESASSSSSDGKTYFSRSLYHFTAQFLLLTLPTLIYIVI